jgi:hypothetical protein
MPIERHAISKIHHFQNTWESLLAAVSFRGPSPGLSSSPTGL